VSLNYAKRSSHDKYVSAVQALDVPSGPPSRLTLPNSATPPHIRKSGEDPLARLCDLASTTTITTLSCTSLQATLTLYTHSLTLADRKYDARSADYQHRTAAYFRMC
jgi:hypothetical protein